MSEGNNEAKKGALIAKIAKIQGLIGGAVTVDEVNPYHSSKYTSLAKLMKELIPKLAAEEIALMHEVVALNDGKILNVITRLVTTDGETTEIGIPMPISKFDPQGVGSAISYGRRYGVSALFGIAQDDDDGEGAMDRSAKSPAQSKAQTKSQPKPQTGAAKANDSSEVRYLDEVRINKFLDNLKAATKENIELAGKYIADRKDFIRPEDADRMNKAYQERRKVLLSIA